MGSFGWAILLIVTIPVAALIGHAVMAATKPTQFAALGDVTGKTSSEIEAVVGHANDVSAHAEGTLRQWIKISGVGGYHYAILFDHDDKAIGFVHQSVSSP